MYEYAARLQTEAFHADGTVTPVKGIVDGDTLHVTIDLGLDTYQSQTIRLYGVNTPEMNTAEGKAARDYALDWFARHVERPELPSRSFTIRTVKDRREKYGRYLGIVIAPDGAILNQDIVNDGYGQVYYP